MAGLITRFPSALSASGLVLPRSRFTPSAEAQAFYTDPAVKEAWDVRMDFGRNWIGRKAGLVATMLGNYDLPRIRKTPGGQSQALFGLSNAMPTAFATPSDANLWPVASDYTLIMYGQGDPLYTTIGAFFGNARDDSYTSTGDSTGQTGAAWFGYNTSAGNIIGTGQTKLPAANAGTAAGTAAPAIQSTPLVYPTGLHWIALSWRESTKTMRLLVDGVVIKTATGVTRGNLMSRLLIGANSLDLVSLTRPLKGYQVMTAASLIQAIGETDQAALLAKASAYFEQRRALA